MTSLFLYLAPLFKGAVKESLRPLTQPKNHILTKKHYMRKRKEKYYKI